jgi:hypothetical protein
MGQVSQTEAKALREIAERCKEHPVFYRQRLELAQRCDDMANNLWRGAWKPISEASLAQAGGPHDGSE